MKGFHLQLFLNIRSETAASTIVGPLHSGSPDNRACRKVGSDHFGVVEGKFACSGDGGANDQIRDETVEPFRGKERKQ